MKLKIVNTADVKPVLEVWDGGSVRTVEMQWELKQQPVDALDDALREIQKGEEEKTFAALRERILKERI